MEQPPIDMMDDGNIPQPNFGEDMQQPQQFDTNFDAGVEADEESDPKRFIQQLTGKLSQSLRKYNQDNGQPDVELNKYVAGMITKQATEGLSQTDAKEILDKIQSDEDFAVNTQDEQSEQGDMSQQQNPNESKINKGYNLEEIVNGVLNHSEPQVQQQKQTNKNSFRKQPFTSPNFER